jgi:hypothetical protein
MRRLEKRKFYYQWKTKTGVGIGITLLEYIDKVRVNGSPLTFTFNDVEYEGEVWKCRMPDGTHSNLKFRVKKVEEDVPWNYNKDFILDRNPNPIVDTYEMVESGKIYQINKDESDWNMINDRLAYLVNFERNQAAHMRLRFRTTPTMRSAREWLEYKQKHPKEVEELEYKLKHL